MNKLIQNIGQLVNVRQTLHVLRGGDLAVLPCLTNAFLILEEERIASFGTMDSLRFSPKDFDYTLDATDRLVMPSWCDSHTHLVYAGSRESEFVDKIKGLSYASIAAKGGGILNSAQKLNACNEDDLYRQSLKRLQNVVAQGTGAIEIKSGYGLTVEGELKMLRVIKRLRTATKIPIKATFLGAHAIPAPYKDNREAYIQLIIEQMLPAVAGEGLADFIDVFCEKGFFTPDETEKIARAGRAYGLKPKLHVNQLNSIGGIDTGLRLNAVSLDHLETMTAGDITMLANAPATMATLLPTAAFFLRMPYQPARTLLDAGCAVALASDYNPGSSPSGNMNFVVSLSCVQMRMLPEEAINAATLNGAYAMELGNEVGSITAGKLANLIITRPVPSLAFLPYSFGDNLIERVVVAGEFNER